MKHAGHDARPRLACRWLGASLLTTCILGAAAPMAWAHPMRLGVLRIVERDGEPTSAWLRYSGTEDRPAGAEIVWPSHCRARELSWSDGDGTGRTRRFSVDCGSRGLGGADLGVREIPPDVQIVLEIERSGQVGFRHILDAHRPAVVVPRSGFDGAVLPEMFRLGLEHVASGVDHLLFLVALVALVGVGRSSRRRLVWTITSFTAGHALALCAASAELVQAPSAPVEALIALSIVLLAAELARHGRAPPGRAPPGLTARAPAVVALPFGLLHGLGFAGALTAAGLPRGSLAEALLGFNLGVEAGQLTVALLIAGALLSLQRAAPSGSRHLPRAVAYAVGVPAAAWTVARLAVLGSG